MVFINFTALKGVPKFICAVLVIISVIRFYKIGKKVILYIKNTNEVQDENLRNNSLMYAYKRLHVFLYTV